VLPAFQGVLTKLKEYQRDHGYEFFAVLQSGIDKLEEYQQEIESIPTYTLAICKLFISVKAFFNEFSSVESKPEVTMV
jgi:hypothetical protein